MIYSFLSVFFFLIYQLLEISSGFWVVLGAMFGLVLAEISGSLPSFQFFIVWVAHSAVALLLPPVTWIFLFLLGVVQLSLTLLGASLIYFCAGLALFYDGLILSGHFIFWLLGESLGGWLLIGRFLADLLAGGSFLFHYFGWFALLLDYFQIILFYLLSVVLSAPPAAFYRSVARVLTSVVRNLDMVPHTFVQVIRAALTVLVYSLGFPLIFVVFPLGLGLLDVLARLVENFMPLVQPVFWLLLGPSALLFVLVIFFQKVFFLGFLALFSGFVHFSYYSKGLYSLWSQAVSAVLFGSWVGLGRTLLLTVVGFAVTLGLPPLLYLFETLRWAAVDLHLLLSWGIPLSLWRSQIYLHGWAAETVLRQLCWLNGLSLSGFNSYVEAWVYPAATYLKFYVPSVTYFGPVVSLSFFTILSIYFYFIGKSWFRFYRFARVGFVLQRLQQRLTLGGHFDFASLAQRTALVRRGCPPSSGGVKSPSTIVHGLAGSLETPAQHMFFRDFMRQGTFPASLYTAPFQTFFQQHPFYYHLADYLTHIRFLFLGFYQQIYRVYLVRNFLFLSQPRRHLPLFHRRGWHYRVTHFLVSDRFFFIRWPVFFLSIPLALLFAIIRCIFLCLVYFPFFLFRLCYHFLTAGGRRLARIFLRS